ncbi:MAG: hypothetical protein ACJ786_37005 [Catenulispora sp.]
MNAAIPYPAKAGRSLKSQVGVQLVSLAAASGAAILVAAAVVPVVTVQSPPTTAVAPSGDMPVPSPSGPLVLTAQPRVTLVAHDGVAVLGLAAIPLVVALGVGLLLWYAVRRGSRPALLTAWVLAVALAVAAVVGFVTFLIGVVVIPVGALLIAACARTAPGAPRTSGRRL